MEHDSQVDPADMIQAMNQYETGGDFFRARVHGLTVGEDLAGNIVPGTAGNVSLSFNANFTVIQRQGFATTGAAIGAKPYDVWFIAVQDGKVIIPAGGTVQQIMGLEATDLMTAEEDDAQNEDVALVADTSVVGSGYGTGLTGGSWKSFVRGVKRIARKVIPMAGMALSMVPTPQAQIASRAMSVLQGNNYNDPIQTSAGDRKLIDNVQALRQDIAAMKGRDQLTAAGLLGGNLRRGRGLLRS